MKLILDENDLKIILEKYYNGVEKVTISDNQITLLIDQKLFLLEQHISTISTPVQTKRVLPINPPPSSPPPNKLEIEAKNKLMASGGKERIMRGVF